MQAFSQVENFLDLHLNHIFLKIKLIKYFNSFLFIFLELFGKPLASCYLGFNFSTLVRNYR
ncbi:MAG: hypothetical protein A2Z73_06880 [Deltaproteobacteria bacterium RBG_13_60_28]|nr:MAG: hypothetical protein A2Z73_06880 [Deltaproteobacteria bacterium RBG_13_60_28]